jgi:hypothetical protein
MIRRYVRLLALGTVAMACASALAPPAQAEDFLSALFGAFGARPRGLPFASEGNPNTYGPQGEARPRYAGGQAYCVRTCDGRYFPMSRVSNANPVQLCNSFCPASKTQVFTGSDINYAAAANGARYADSENAFVYRKQIVPGCTCNGRDAFGLAPIDLAADPTIKQGDIVVTAEGPVSLRGNKWARAAVDLKPSVPLARAPAREQIEPGDQAPPND